ncbi:M56 family metallopeptidase [Streptomyces sp. NPDC001599]|uniref:M56 family metallopeptidase n=1 Tax=Streptomyces sp. NPDC001599 TaxID=3364591 RepID=UPI0036AB5007
MSRKWAVGAGLGLGALLALALLDVLIYRLLRAWRRRPEAGPSRGVAEVLDILALTGGAAVALVIATVAVTVLVRALVITRRALVRIGEHALPPSRRLLSVARQVLPGNAVRIVQLDVREPLALTYGLLRPLVAVSTGLVDRATDEELAAVLGHEMHHARRRHPLGRLVVETVASALWFLPVPRILARHVRMRQELSADQAALTLVAPSVVASALMKCLSESGPATLGIGMGGDVALEARVAQLEEGPKRFAHFLGCCHLRRTVLVAVALVGLVLYCCVATVAGGVTAVVP